MPTGSPSSFTRVCTFHRPGCTKMDPKSKMEDCSELSESLMLIFSEIEVLMSTIE